MGSAVGGDTLHDFNEITWLRIFRASVEQVDEGILITDAELDAPGPRILYANPAFCRISGYPLDELLGHDPRFLQGPETDRDVLERLRRTLEAGSAFSGQTINYRKDNTPYEVQWTVSPVHDEHGNAQQYVAVLRDVTEREALHRRLQYLAYHDALTGLLNHQRIQTVLGDEVERARRYGHDLTLVVLDLDHFKAVNDQHGHAVGDRVLRAVAEILRARLRTSDAAGRWGGEEFVLVLPHSDAHGARRVAEAVREELARQALCDEVSLTLSAGVAEYAFDLSPETLFRIADQALYRAKCNGRNRVEVAAPPSADPQR